MAKINQAMQDLLRYNAAILPQKRSSFNKSHSHTTTLDSAYLVPLMWDRVLPGDEKKIRYSGLARMATPIHPVMDEANLDVWAFYVPDRLWWCHAKEFYGENKDASFNPDGQYVMPSLSPVRYMTRCKTSISNEDTGIGSLNDYFGFPLSYAVPDAINNDPDFHVTAGLHRSYQLIWNEWFRNSSIQPALRLSDGDDVSSSEWSIIKKIRKVCKYPDFFTSLLREPQAGDDVTLPLGDWAPVVSRGVDVPANMHEQSLSMAPTILTSTGAKYSTIYGGHNVLGVVGEGEAGSEPAGFKSGQVISGYDSDISNDASEPMYTRNLWADLMQADKFQHEREQLERKQDHDKDFWDYRFRSKSANSYDDMTDFIKRLRNRYRSTQIDYYYSGEYGDQNFRPHFHLIIYNLPLDDLVFWKLNENGDPIYTSDILFEAWQKGFVTVSRFSWRGAAYTASYVEKKRDGRLRCEYEGVGLTPEKCRMSRRPGIAYDYYMEHYDELWKNNGLSVSRDVNSSGHLGLPRYFRKLAEKGCGYDAFLDYQKRALDRSNVLAPLEIENGSFDLNSINRMLEFEEREILSKKVNKFI